MIRRLLSLLSALSLVPCAATGALWLLSYVSPVGLVRSTAAVEYAIQSYRGGLALAIIHEGMIMDDWKPENVWFLLGRYRGVDLDLGPQPSDPPYICPVNIPAFGGQGILVRTFLEEDRVPSWHRLGFIHGVLPRGRGAPSMRNVAIEVYAIPYWFLLLLTALPLVLRGVRYAARRSRRGRGRCERCGYDLRATPSRCPECGMEQKPLRLKTSSPEIR